MGIFDGKHILVTGVITESSIAYHVARLIQEEGGTVVLTGYGRLSLVERIARRLPDPKAPVLELDVTNQEHLDTLAERVALHAPALDGVLHAVAYAPQEALGDRITATCWSDVATTVHVSAYSLTALAASVRPLLRPGSAIVGLDFDARFAWSSYGWMGVAKAALESASRYLARELGPSGIRVNLVAAGPLSTIAARNIPGFEDIGETWQQRSPLGWSLSDPTGVARSCAALLTDWFPATTGQILYADGGAHAMGD
jgi:enoyl-[acyl-carrier protein] reductase I